MRNKSVIAILCIAVFILIVLFLFRPKLASNIENMKADISGLKMKSNVVILNKNSYKKTIKKQAGITSFSVLSGNTDISDNTKIKTNDILVYNNNRYSIAVLGDANADGVVEISDITRIYRIMSGSYVPPSQVERIAADANEDNEIDISDITKTYKISKIAEEIEEDEEPPVQETEYKIIYDANGGTGAPAPQTYVYSPTGTITLSNVKPTRSGYVFVGWSTNKNATTPSYQPSQNWNRSNASNYTLYAVWDSINVLFIGNSKTFYNRMPKLFEKMAKQTNKNVYVFMITAKGKTLQDHVNDRSSVISNQVKNKRYDYVILQEQTEAGENYQTTKKGIDDIIKLVKQSGSKSTNAVIINNVIWREINTNTTYLGFGTSSSPIYQAQTTADNIAKEIGNLEKNQTVVLTGRQLFDYEYAAKKVDVPNGEYHLYQSDRNHPKPGASYLEAGLLYEAIFGYPSSNTQIVVGNAWSCDGNAYTNGTNDWNRCSGTHTFNASSESALWKFMRENRNYIFRY